MKSSEILTKLYGNSTSMDNSNGRDHAAPRPGRPLSDDMPPNFAVYYDQTKKLYWAKEGHDEWMNYSEVQLSRELRHAGVRKDVFNAQGLTMVENSFRKIMKERNVHFAGEIAGYPVGTYEILGLRVLVTRGPKIPKPVKMAFPAVERFLDSLLLGERKYFDAWVKSALQALKAGSPFRPGQVLCMAGPPGCGKSLLQDIITEILGGRSAKPYRYLTGETNFNSDLFRAEHLVIEDEVASVDMRTRRHFAASIKGLCVNRVQSFHPKGKESMPMSPFWRLSISVNDDQDHLMVIPPLDDSLVDKIILLRAAQAVFPFAADDLNARRAFREQLSRQLPGYLFWLRGWKLPASLQDQRFGCVAYQNEDLKQSLMDLEPEHKLWTLIQCLGIIPTGCQGWTGTSAKLEMLMREKDRSGEVSRICYFTTACGVLLAKLAKIYPQNVIAMGSKGRSKNFQIILPQDDEF